MPATTREAASAMPATTTPGRRRKRVRRPASSARTALGHPPPALEHHAQRAREAGEALLVRRVKGLAVRAVQELGDREDAAVAVAQRQTENAARPEAGLAIDRRV